MDGIGGPIKNQVYKNVQPEKIMISNPVKFSPDAHTNKIVTKITSVYYLPLTYIMEEPEEIATATAIPGTLEAHQMKRKNNAQCGSYLEFFKMPKDKIPYFTLYYHKPNDPIIYGHVNFNGIQYICLL